MNQLNVNVNKEFLFCILNRRIYAVTAQGDD